MIGLGGHLSVESIESDMEKPYIWTKTRRQHIFMPWKQEITAEGFGVTK